MKSRTSFFNGAILKKDCTRFAPVWILYSLYLFITALSSWSAASYAKVLSNTLVYSGIISCGYALLNAQLLFGDLYNTKMVNALHALPLRRESWFGSHVIAGLLFSLVPNLLMMFISAILMPSLQDAAAYWFLSVSLEYLFYFGLAVFCSLIVGNRIGMAAFYAMVNAGAWLIYWIVDSLYMPQYPDISISFMFFSPLCPLVYLFSNQAMTVELSYTNYYPQTLVSEALTLNAECWIYLVVIAVIGLALLIPSLIMYRQRSLEHAGNLITVTWLKPVFLVALTLTTGVLCQVVLGKSLNDVLDWVYLVIGLVAGYFAGQMLLMRTVRVVNWKNLAGLASIVILLLGSMGINTMDPLDLKHWIPEKSLIESIFVYVPGWSYWGDDDEDFQEDLNELLALNQAIFQEGDVELTKTTVEQQFTWVDADGTEQVEIWYETTYDGFFTNFYYTLSNGVTITRRCPVEFESTSAQMITEFLSQPEIVLGETYTHQELAAATMYFKPSDRQYIHPTAQDAKALIDAIIADCQAGTMAQHDYFHSEPGYELLARWRLDGDYVTLNLVIYPDAENTMAWLVQQEFYQEYLNSLAAEEIPE